MKLDFNQIKGAVITVLAIIGGYLLESTFGDILAGILAAVGISYLFKIIPFRKKKMAKF